MFDTTIVWQDSSTPFLSSKMFCSSTEILFNDFYQTFTK